jgi:capsular polysaccharide transport system ATP-binding protein
VSVELRNVSKNIRRGKDARVLFDTLNFRVEVGQRVAILGLPKSGKSTLLRLICGTDQFYSGSIERSSSVSWPIPLGDFLVPLSSVAANIRFIMRLYALDSDEILRGIADLVEISEFLNKRLNECPKYVRGRLAFALGIGLGFNVCLFDERVSTVDKEFRPNAIDIVKSLSPRKAIVVATSLPKEVASLCDTAFVLENGRLTPFPDVKKAIEYYKSLVENAADDDADVADTGAEVADEEFVLEIGI